MQFVQFFGVFARVQHYLRRSLNQIQHVVWSHECLKKNKSHQTSWNNPVECFSLDMSGEPTNWQWHCLSPSWVGGGGSRRLEALWENAQSYTESSYWCCEESFFRRKTWASRCVRRKEGGKTQAVTLSEISAWLGSTGGTLGGANDCYQGRLILMCRCGRRCPTPPERRVVFLSPCLKKKVEANNCLSGLWNTTYPHTHLINLSWFGMKESAGAIH